MTEEEKNNLEEYQNRIDELEKKLNEAEDFSALREKYDSLIADKDKEIESLQKTVQETEKKVNKTVDTLEKEVQQRLDANEEYQKLLKTVEELEHEKAENLVDSYVAKGILVPKQRDIAIDFALNDPDKFNELYKDAKPIVDLSRESKSRRFTSTIDKLSNYL